MRPVFLNIADNACYASHQKAQKAAPGYLPTLTPTTRDIGAEIEIRIADNGPGMPASVVGKIFNPLFTTKPTGEGTEFRITIPK